MVESAHLMRCARRYFCVLRLAGIAALVWSAPLAAEETAHVTLVDPAITKCAVCHKSLQAPHPEMLPGQGCLACHVFEQRDGNTYLIDAGSSGGVTEPAPATTGEAVSGRQITSSTGAGEVASESPAPPPAPVVAPSPREAARSMPEPAAAIATMAPDLASSERAEAPQDLIEDGSRARYAAGAEAFRQGDVESAFRAWETMLDEAADGYTLQIAVDRHLESARHALETYPGNGLYVVPRGSAYYVLSGVFVSRASAAEALGRLPDELTRDGAFPTAVRALPTRR
jgi:septal ring-binding cell division protein DamX